MELSPGRTFTWSNWISLFCTEVNDEFQLLNGWNRFHDWYLDVLDRVTRGETWENRLWYWEWRVRELERVNSRSPVWWWWAPSPRSPRPPVAFWDWNAQRHSPSIRQSPTRMLSPSDPISRVDLNTNPRPNTTSTSSGANVDPSEDTETPPATPNDGEEQAREKNGVPADARSDSSSVQTSNSSSESASGIANWATPGNRSNSVGRRLRRLFGSRSDSPTAPAATPASASRPEQWQEQATN